MNLVPIETPTARMAMARKPLELLDAAFGIVAAGEGLQVFADELIKTLAESFRFFSGARDELLVDRERDIH